MCVSICIHLQEDDGGQYRCTARNEAGEVSLTMNLDIASSISVGKYLTISYISVLQGQDTYLEVSIPRKLNSIKIHVEKHRPFANTDGDNAHDEMPLACAFLER